MGNHEKNKDCKEDPEKKEKKPDGKTLLIAAAAVVMIVLGLVTVFSGDGELPEDQTGSTGPSVTQTQPQTQPADELTMEEPEEQDGQMVLRTSFGVLRYPFAFSDLLQPELAQDTDRQGIAFSARISGELYPVFTIWFGGHEGLMLGELVLPESGKTVGVYAEMSETPEELTGGALASFYAAQECFNDVSASLMETEGFTPAD